MYVSKARIRSALATVLPTGWFEEMKMIWLISVATINVFSKILSRFCNKNCISENRQTYMYTKFDYP